MNPKECRPIVLLSLLLLGSLAPALARGETVVELRREVQAGEVLKSVDWSPDGALIAATGWLAHVRIWRADNLTEVAGFSEVRQGAAALQQHNVAFSADGRELAAGNLVAQIWDRATDRSRLALTAPFVDLTRPQPVGIVSLAFSADQHLLLVAYYTRPPELGNPVIAYRMTDGSVAWRYTQRPIVGLPLIHTPLVVIPGRDEVAFGTGEGNRDGDRLARIVILDASTGAPRRTIDRIHIDAPTTLAVSPNGRWFASGTNTGHREVSLNPQTHRVTNLNNQDPIRIWDVMTGALVGELQVKNEVWALAFSPDAKYLIATQSESPLRMSLRVWRLDSRLLVQTLTTAPIYGLAFSPDGHWLAAAGGNGVALFSYHAR